MTTYTRRISICVLLPVAVELEVTEPDEGGQTDVQSARLLTSEVSPGDVYASCGDAEFEEIDREARKAWEWTER